MEGSLPAFNRLVFLPNQALQGIVYQQSQLTGKASDGWRLVNVKAFNKGGFRELQACHNLGTREGFGADHFEMQVCLTNVISYNRLTCLLDVGKAVDVVYLFFSKLFDTTAISYSILLEKLAAHGSWFTG